MLSFLAFQCIMMEINTLRNIKSILLFVYSISYMQNRQLLNFWYCRKWLPLINDDRLRHGVAEKGMGAVKAFDLGESHGRFREVIMN